MAEKEKIDINTPIEARIKAAKGTKIGDDLVNPLERKLYDDIITEHGNIMSDTRETMNQNFLNLIEDVGDISEANQARLRNVAEMLGVTLTTKDGGLQMNYELFQKILKFQKEHEMKLTGVVDDTLYQALKKHVAEEKKAETPSTTPTEEKKDTPYTGYTPEKKEQTREETIQSIAEKPYINSDSAYPVGIQDSTITEPAPVPVETKPYERIPPPPVPVTPTGIASVWVEAGVKVAPKVAASEWEKTPVATPVETTTTTQEKPTVKALPIEEAAKKTAEVETILTEEAKKLWITIDDINLAQSPFGQSIVDMILYYESGDDEEKYVRRKKDIGGADIGWGINTGSSREELTYALGGTENYETWRDSKIPTKELVRQSVQRLLHSRIAVTRKSCGDKGIDFDSLPQNVKAVMIDLHYNMPNNINEFTKFWAAIKDKNWQEAGRQLVDSGSGSPSRYLSQTGGRAYANALGLSTGDVANHRENKREAEKLGSGEILNRYAQKVGEYGKKVGMWERKEIVKNAENAGDIITQTTSTDVLSTNWSTKSVTKILDKYIQEHPEERAALISGLVEKIGNFSRPLQTPEEVGAFQQLVYLTNPEGFKELQYIDGEYGDKTKRAFMQEVYTINWSAMLAKITDAASLANLTPFEQEVLKTNLSRSSENIGSNSSPEEIRKAQILLALNGELGDTPIDGTWSPELEKLINLTPPLSSTEWFDAAKARTILTKRYQISSSAMGDMDDGTSLDKNRTGLVGLRGCAIAGAMNLAEAMGNPDGLRITGGTESWHVWLSFGSNVYTHSNGYKLDFWVHPALVNFTGLNRMWKKVTMDIKWQKVLFYRHGPNDHFDVTFYPTN